MKPVLMTRRKKTSSRVNPPRIPAQPEPLRLVPTDIGEGDRFVDALIEDCSLNDLRAYQLELKGVRLRHVELQNARLERLELTDVLFDQCDLANGKWHESIIYRTRANESRLTGFDAAGSSLKHVLFESCALDLSSFRQASFNNVAFRNCIMRDADFGGADLRGVRFYRCDLRKAQFSGAKLDGADFRGSDIEGIGIKPDELRGVMVSPAQMVTLSWMLARHLGVVVGDEEE